MTVGIIIVALYLIDFWIDEAQEITLFRKLKIRLNFKPFNCGYCLSSQIGIVLSLVFLNPIFIALPLIYKYALK
jgi:hypothetical protein